MHANVSHDTTGPQGSTWEGQPSYVPRTTHARLTGGHPEDNKRRNTRHPRNDKTTHDKTIEGAAVRTQPAAQYCMAPHDVSRHALASTEANPQTTRHVPPGGHVALMPRASGSGTQIRIGAVGIAAAMMRGGVYDGNRGSTTSAVPPPEAADAVASLGTGCPSTGAAPAGEANIAATAAPPRRGEAACTTAAVARRPRPCHRRKPSARWRHLGWAARQPGQHPREERSSRPRQRHRTSRPRRCWSRPDRWRPHVACPDDRAQAARP